MSDVVFGRQLSRRGFLKSGGALVVGFSMFGSARSAARAATAEGLSPYTSVLRNSNQVDSYLAVHADNTVSLLANAVEVGTGSATGFLMLAAEELDIDLAQVKYVWPDSAVGVNPQLSTSSSAGTKEIGPQIRAAAAYAKQTLLGLAAANLGVSASALTVKSGVVSGGGRSVTYGQLLGERLFNTTLPVGNIYYGSYSGNAGANGLPTPQAASMIGPTLDPGVPPTKPVSQYTLVGTRVPRV